MSAITDFRKTRDDVFQSLDLSRIRAWSAAWGISQPSDDATLSASAFMTEGETAALGAKAAECQRQMIALKKEKRKEDLDSHGK